MSKKLKDSEVEMSRDTPALPETPGLAQTQVLASAKPPKKKKKKASTATARSWRPAWMPGERYEWLEELGEGGMGKVWKVFDHRLKRELALKEIKPGWIGEDHIASRFVEEAQATSQLQHPGIVPIYDFEELPSGHCYFTMKIIRGRTFAEVLEGFHKGPSGSGEWSLRRLLEAFRRVCEAVSYAHSRGVLHRDLKPQNIMVGEHGEVVVMDWGLAKISNAKEHRAPKRQELRSVVTERAQSQAFETQLGVVQGTPGYMSPEQASGRELGPQSDIYALGVILCELLTGHRSFDDGDGLGALPEELVEICKQAMAPEPEQRFESARELARRLGDWLEGRRQRERALTLVDEARALLPEAVALRSRAQALAEEAASALEQVGLWEPEERKSGAWQMQDQSRLLRREARLKELEYERLLHAALTYAPIEEAHAALASWYHEDYQKAERSQNEDAMISSRHRLEKELEALRKSHPVRVELEAYFDGAGALSLDTRPSGAEVRLFRYEPHHRRLVPVFEKSLGLTPLVKIPLAMGSYLLELHKEGHSTVHYPVSISRHEHWDAVHPDGQPRAVWLPAEGALGPDDCYVPGGWFWAGGDPKALKSFPRQRLWVEGFVMRRHPVTNGEFVEFLNDLVDQGRSRDAALSAPCERPGTLGERGPIIYGRDDKGHFELRPDADGDMWYPDEPVTMIDWFSVCTYADWAAQRSGKPWRVSSEWEWEKAARGVDGRLFPWGDFFDPSWCCVAESHADEWLTARIHQFPVDCSPYGIRSLAGNVREWCGELFELARDLPPEALVPQPSPPPATLPAKSLLKVRGGSWGLKHAIHCRAASRNNDVAGGRDGGLGFRLCRSLDDDEG